MGLLYYFSVEKHMNSTIPPRDVQDHSPDREDLDEENRIDKDLQETFPASDPPATGGTTKIGNDGKETASR